jgi:Protein of unknown function (DUF3164)
MNEKEAIPAGEASKVPAGYWKDANGHLVPNSKVKDIDKLRHYCVVELCQAARKASADLIAFKLTATQMIQEFVDKSLAQYEVKHGGKKGNITLVSFDGRFKIVRSMQETINFDERLQAAKALIDECIQGWSKGSNANIKVLVNDAFQVDKTGKISTGRVLGLRRLDITDATWLKAMQAISDSMNVSHTKPYIRFYELDEGSGEFVPIALDVAAL